jgi:type IV pilus assembly protein PilY1
MDNRGNVWVFFGTGQFLGTSDRNQTETGGFYAIKDGCWKGDCTTAYSNLLDVSVTSVNTDGTVAGVSGACTSGATSTWSSLLTGSYACDGWSIFFQNLGEAVDFAGDALSHDGERVISTPLVLGGIVTWTTYIPGIEVCEFEGDSNLYAVYYKTGTSFKKYVFKEQKDQAAPDPNVARVKHLGKGMPSSVSAQITESGTVKGFAQQSTGSIAEIEQDPAFRLNSGRTGWIEEELE